MGQKQSQQSAPSPSGSPEPSSTASGIGPPGVNLSLEPSLQFSPAQPATQNFSREEPQKDEEQDHEPGADAEWARHLLSDLQGLASENGPTGENPSMAEPSLAFHAHGLAHGLQHLEHAEDEELDDEPLDGRAHHFLPSFQGPSPPKEDCLDIVRAQHKLKRLLAKYSVSCHSMSVLITEPHKTLSGVDFVTMLYFWKNLSMLRGGAEKMCAALICDFSMHSSPLLSIPQNEKPTVCWQQKEKLSRLPLKP